MSEVDQHHQIKLALMGELNIQAKNLINFLNTLNLNPQLKSHCFLNLDQALYWARCAIEVMEFPSSHSAEKQNDTENPNKPKEIEMTLEELQNAISDATH